MTNVRRYFDSGNTCFLTHVTHNREPILVSHFELLWNALNKYRSQTGIEVVAWVVLPDHMYLLLEYENQDISTVMRQVKLSFSTSLRGSVGRKQGRIWQYRFWDHMIRDQGDLNTHIDYIHFNPAKHGLIDRPLKWPYSSMGAYAEQGLYSADWGVLIQPVFDGEFGE